MNLLTITVCVDYSDILSICIQKNIKNLKNWHIITSSKDIDTQNLCTKYSLPFFITDLFYKNKSAFNKAAGLNDFVANRIVPNIENIDWILLLDSDIIINDSVEHIEKLYYSGKLSHQNLYSCPRLIFDNYTEFQNNGGYLEKRIDFNGYFQLFNIEKIKNQLQSKSAIFREYIDASKYDDWFRDKYWPNYQNRTVINKTVFHLGPIRQNWAGRKTSQWNT